MHSRNGLCVCVCVCESVCDSLDLGGWAYGLSWFTQQPFFPFCDKNTLGFWQNVHPLCLVFPMVPD